MEARIEQYSTGSGWVIQPASWRDLGPVRELEKVCFPVDAWPLLDLIAALTMSRTVRFKVEREGMLVGFAVGDIRKFRSIGWIATIGVHPEWRGMGIGRALLSALEQAMGMPRVRLSVRPSNAAAVEMYNRAGYWQVGRWPRYYAGGEDAMVMEKVVGMGK